MKWEGKTVKIIIIIIIIIIMWSDGMTFIICRWVVGLWYYTRYSFFYKVLGSLLVVFFKIYFLFKNIYK